MKQLNRREILTAAATAACLCAVADPSRLLAQEMPAAPAPGAAPASQPTTLDIGTKDDFKTDGITDKWLKKPDGAVAVVRKEGKLYAATSLCTHKGCAVAKAADGTSFHCPCHGANYDIAGKVTKGPAKNSLVHYGISVNDAGHIIVDKTKTFKDTEYDQDGSFIALT